MLRTATITIDNDTYKRIKAEASAKKRSISSQISYICEKYIQKQISEETDLEKNKNEHSLMTPITLQEKL